MGKLRWTKELLTSEARKYKTRKAFQNGSPAAYQSAYRRGLLPEICEFMGPPTPNRFPIRSRTWTHEVLLAEAGKYATRGEFRTGSPGAYTACIKRGILDEACANMESPYTKWTLEALIAEARKYETRREFYEKSRAAHDAAYRMGVVDIVCAHMSRGGSSPDDPTRMYWYLHPEGYCYIGISSNWEYRHEQHSEGSHNPHTAWIAEQQAPEYWEGYAEHDGAFHPIEAPRRVMERAERLAIRIAVRDGWKVVNKIHNPQYDFVSGAFSWETIDSGAIAA